MDEEAEFYTFAWGNVNNYLLLIKLMECWCEVDFRAIAIDK